MKYVKIPYEMKANGGIFQFVFCLLGALGRVIAPCEVSSVARPAPTPLTLTARPRSPPRPCGQSLRESPNLDCDVISVKSRTVRNYA